MLAIRFAHAFYVKRNNYDLDFPSFYEKCLNHLDFKTIHLVKILMDIHIQNYFILLHLNQVPDDFIYDQKHSTKVTILEEFMYVYF